MQKRFLIVMVAACAWLTMAAQVCVLKEGTTTTSYATLEAALSYANVHTESSFVVYLTADYTLPAGHHLVSANTTLVVPCTDDATSTAYGPCRKPVLVNAYTAPTEFRRLTLASGANVDVQGTIETEARQSISFSYMGAVTGAYGRIQMDTLSQMTIENNAHLRSWGYVTGQGAIDAKRGAIVHEFFQVTDWKGGNTTSKLVGQMTPNYKPKRVFPINQYYIQNVETATTYHPGALLVTATAIKASIYTAQSDSIVIIGSPSKGGLMLLDESDMTADTWVRKTYLPATDQQLYEINSSASIGSIDILIGAAYDMHSRDYTLPITNNMLIRLLSGYMDITQSTELLPGAVIENMKETIVSINSGKRLYLYDSSVWKNCYGQKYTIPVAYSPTRTFTRSATTQGQDAELFIHGTWAVYGSMLTSAGGAYIHSTNEDAGKIEYYGAPAPKDSLYEFLSATESACEFSVYPFTPAQLTNGDMSLVSSASARINDTYCYTDNAWTKRIVDGCWTIDKAEAFPHWKYYAHPSDFVEVAATVASEMAFPEEDATTHLYYSIDSLRQFILLSDCQWWEVEPADGIWYAAKNSTYYEYDYEWIKAMRTIEWYNGTTLLDEPYQVAYRTVPVYLGETPTKPATPTTYFRFIGWNTDPEATTAMTLEPIVEDTQFYAIFEEAQVTATEQIQAQQSASKRLQNGELIIIRNGIHYNALGQKQL